MFNFRTIVVAFEISIAVQQLIIIKIIIIMIKKNNNNNNKQICIVP